LTAWHGGDALVLAVAEQNNNTIVVINSVGPLILEPWIDHPNVTAVCIPLLPLRSSFESILTAISCRSSGQDFLVKRPEIHLLMYFMGSGIPPDDFPTRLRRVLKTMELNFLEVKEQISSMFHIPMGKHLNCFSLNLH
jgi:hypothetical protein